MAEYRNMSVNNQFVKDCCCLSVRLTPDCYQLAIGPILIRISKEEKENILNIWNKIENGIDPETNEPFTKLKLGELGIEL